MHMTYTVHDSEINIVCALYMS
uniref:Uncharacterized protein n=1 Tax=Arundo donax TaxID=35708 RepID=A0A0A8ZJS4_ARUDO